MHRPPSIVRYERLYLLGLLTSLVGWYVTWPALEAQVSRMPQTHGFGWMVPASLAATIAITLVLWFLTARRASVVAKWVVVVLAGFSVVRLLLNVPAFARGLIAVPAFAAAALTALLGAWAASLLFRSDAKAWFGENLHGDAA